MKSVRNIIAVLAIFWGSGIVIAQDRVSYAISWENPHERYYTIAMEVEPPDEKRVAFRIPAWRPSRYLIQNYAKNVVQFRASDEKDRPLQIHRVDKSTWEVERGKAKRIKVTYRYYADQLDAGSSWLDDAEAYFNPITCFMYMPGREHLPVTLKIDRPSDWEVATAMPYDASADRWTAEDYHEFADSPFIVSPTLDTHAFDHDGSRIELVFQGEGNYDADAVVDDVRKIVAAQCGIMQNVPTDRYVFLYHLVPYPMGHGVEHKNSTSIVRGPADFSNSRFYNGFLGVTAHEFFHAWLVERIRPEAIFKADYASERYTSTFWIYEGITSYYTGITMLRAGIRDEKQYLRDLARLFGRFGQTPGRKVTSLADVSWDSWTKGGGEAPPNTYYSFYSGGSVMGALLDLRIRGVTENRKSLDDVMIYLFRNYAKKNNGVPEDGMLRAINKVSGSKFDDFFADYVDGTREIDFSTYLDYAGLAFVSEVDSDAPGVDLGISLERGGSGTKVRNVRPDSPATRAGLAIGDILVAIDGRRTDRNNIDQVLERFSPGDTAELTAFRREKLHNFIVTFAEPIPGQFRIEPVETPTDAQLSVKAGWLKAPELEDPDPADAKTGDGQ